VLQVTGDKVTGYFERYEKIKGLKVDLMNQPSNL